MQHHLKRLTIDITTDIPTSFFEMLSRCISDIKDNAFKALLLTLPSFDEMVSQIEQVNATSLCAAIEQLKQLIATQLESQLLGVYQQCEEFQSVDEGEQVANRSLQNVSLSYLSAITAHEELTEKQYYKANNMTQALGALTAAIKQNTSMFKVLMSDFENQWRDTTLVMDKWFTLSASVPNDDIYGQLTALMARDDFSMNNPNRARSLVGGFVTQNPKYFHCESGRGYQFLADRIVELNKINPQVASRLITPLIQFKEFDVARQNLMKTELQRIQKTPELARDLVEKLDAALT